MNLNHGIPFTFEEDYAPQAFAEQQLSAPTFSQSFSLQQLVPATQPPTHLHESPQHEHLEVVVSLAYLESQHDPVTLVVPQQESTCCLS